MKYKVLDDREIRVRVTSLVTSQAKGTLVSREEFFAETVVDDNTGHWVRILEGRYAGFFGAVRDANGKIFAVALNQPEPKPEPTNKPVLTVTVEGEGYKSVTVDLIPNDTD